jgi:tRNA (guanine37-N1)-methyltransferase
MATKLKKLLGKILPAKEVQLLVGSYDVVGDIAIILVPTGLRHRERLIGDTILEQNNSIKVVAKRIGKYAGEFRTVPLQIIAGQQRKETQVREFGLRLLVNPETVYYSVRSAGERQRIASLVKSGERVLVMFSGIAPYPLAIAKYSQAGLIVGIEKNPEAHRYGLANLQLNKGVESIELILGDVAGVADRFKEPFDRVVMPLPLGAEPFLGYALALLRFGGTLHFYDMRGKDGADSSVVNLNNVVKRHGRTVTSTRVTRCGHCGPRSFRLCIDAVISL